MEETKEYSIAKPEVCIINVYPSCMFRCKMCYIWKRKDSLLMSFEKIKGFIDALAEFTDRKVEINFTGGEPLLRGDILDLISVSSKHGIPTSLCTNGYLIDYAMAKRLSESGLKGLAISLDSLDEQTHDALRGKPGSYKKIMQAFEHLSNFTSEEFKINIQTIITQQNLNGLVELAKWVQKCDNVCGIYYMAVVQPLDVEQIDNWYREDLYKSLWPQDIGEMGVVINDLIRIKSQERHPKIINSIAQLKAFKSYFEYPEEFLKKISCNLGKYTLNVDYLGDTSACFRLGSIGNICRDGIRDMWYSEKAAKIRQMMEGCNKNCNFLINSYQKETNNESDLRLKEQVMSLDLSYNKSSSKACSMRSDNTCQIRHMMKCCNKNCNFVTDSYQKETDNGSGLSLGEQALELGSGCKKSPKACLIRVVNTCFMRCKMCSSWQKKKTSQELTNEEWKRFIYALKEIVPSWIPISFAGSGEPLAREGILDLIEVAVKKGFIAQMLTNGYLVDQDMASRLGNAGLRGLAISLDSTKEQTHDFLRGKEGTFRRIMKAIGYLRKNKVGITLMTTIMGKNLDEIIDLVMWAAQERIEVRFQAVSKPFETDLDDGWYKKDEWKFLWPGDANKVREVIDELIRLKELGHEILNPLGQLEMFKAYFENPQKPYRLRRCNLGDYLMDIDIYGNLNPCSSMGTWGNIKETHIRDLWYSAKAESFREKIYNCQKPCHYLINCYYEE